MNKGLCVEVTGQTQVSVFSSFSNLFEIWSLDCIVHTRLVGLLSHHFSMGTLRLEMACYCVHFYLGPWESSYYVHIYLDP